MIIERVTSKNRKTYSNLLLNTPIDSDTICYGSKVSDDFASGIILAKKDGENPTRWNIKTFYVSSFFRNLGIGSKLLENLIEEVTTRGSAKLCLTVVTSEQSFEKLKDFLSKRKFENPTTLTTVYRFSEEIFGSNIVRASLNSSNPFENIKFVPINDVPGPIMSDLKINEGITYPKNLSLFINENKLEHINSFVAIENNEKAVGWITGLLAPGDLILYRAFFVDKEYRKNALGLALLNEALKTHLTKFKNLEGLCAVSLDNHSVEKFISLYFKSVKYKKHEYEMTLKLN